MRAKLIRTGYLLGVSSLLAAIIYFFAANWGGFSHWEKLATSTGFLLLMYGLSILFAFRSRRNYLTHLLLVGGSITFGVCTALVGQIYNSHADSYLLFLVWLVPVLLLAFVTRKQAFYVMGLFLLELTMWFYIFPSHVGFWSSELRILISLLIAAWINKMIFVLTYYRVIHSELVKFFSYLVFYGIILALANTLIFDTYGFYMNAIAVVVFAVCFYTFLKRSVQKSYALLTGLFASLYLISKFIEIAVRNFEEWFFFLGIVVFIGLLILNISFIKYVNRISEQVDPSDAEVVNAEQLKRKSESGTLIGRTAGIGLTIASIAIGCISIIGFIMMVFESEYFLFIISIAMLAVILLMKNVHSYIRYTIMAIGLTVGFVSLLMIREVTISMCYVIILAAVWWISRGLYERLMIYSTFAALIPNLQLDWSFEEAILVSFLIHFVIFISQSVAPGKSAAYLKELSFFYGFGFFFWLTFFQEDSLLFYYGSNALFFVLATGSLFLCLKRGYTYYYVISMVFWFLYVIYKYYDLFWSLLNKSITLLVVSALFFVVTYWYERRGERIISQEPSDVRLKIIPISLIILLQLGVTGYQVVKSEIILSQGTEIKLNLAPLDPRSLLQGDYVRLNYDISDAHTLPLPEHNQWGFEQKVRVVLQRDDKGIYILKGLTDVNGPSSKINEVILNGKRQGDRLEYGIETFFVPEGKGFDVQSHAKFALVRVGSNGDAILETLLDEAGNPLLGTK
ncbi:GDYXXLXY domain-containing protein [Brevibacillus ginsengisoli]|uniref:GDYXXLXY domain-containing protein n=1 Tax=Brevibacillus ginsengisoli TaxID=363854 RepID=UPI003CEA1780